MLKYYKMEGLRWSEDKKPGEDTQDWDTAEFERQTEFVAELAVTADKGKQLKELKRLMKRAQETEEHGDFWVARSALQEALAMLPDTPLSLEKIEEYSAQFAIRIEYLMVAWELTNQPWPGEAQDQETAETVGNTRFIHRFVARLGLTALGLW
jgi:hypothetical protein